MCLKHYSTRILFGAFFGFAGVGVARACPESDKLTAADAAESDLFGWSAAVSGNTAVIGAMTDNNGAGSAYIFVRDPAPPHAWTQQAKLTALDAAAGDLYGFSVAIDGDTAVIGAVADNGGAGSAYVFIRSGTTWTQQAKLIGTGLASDANFGGSVSIAGNTVLVGAYANDEVPFNSGAAYVFVRSGTTWTQQAKLTASDAAGGDTFGTAVSLSGESALVSAPGNDDGGNGSGCAYVFVRSGVTWTQQAKLLALDDAANDAFGNAVSIDADTALIGVKADDDAGSSSGSAYVFIRIGNLWMQQAKLTALDAAQTDLFGQSVSVDGDFAVIGSIGDDDGGNGAGSAYLFSRSGTTWTQQTKLTASDAAELDQFGFSVAISGSTILSGAFNDDDAGSNSGSAYEFDVADPDGDSVVTACDNCTGASNVNQLDSDGDGPGDACDNCPLIANANQANLDGDASGDVCDTCTDADGDGFGNPGFPINTCPADNCPTVADPTQSDGDGDGVGDGCDNCPLVANSNQADADGDGLGNVCDSCTDTDGDGFGNLGFTGNTCPPDNCPSVANPTQLDIDGDLMGDECDRGFTTSEQDGINCNGAHEVGPASVGAGNGVFVHNYAGPDFTAGTVRVIGSLTQVDTSTFASEARFEICSPSGCAITDRLTTTGNIFGTLFVDGIVPVTGLSGSNGTWTFEAFDSFNDQGNPDATWNNLTIEAYGPVPQFPGDFTGTPITLPNGTNFPWTTRWTGDHPGVTDGAGEFANASHYGGSQFQHHGNEVAFRLYHPGGNLVLDLNVTDTDLDLLLLNSTGIPTTGTLRRSEGSGLVDEHIVLLAAPAGLYFVVVDGFGEFNVGSSFFLIYKCTCPGDVNGDGSRDGRDIQSFAKCFTTNGAVGGACGCAEVDGLPGINIGDVSEFVLDLLGGGACP